MADSPADRAEAELRSDPARSNRLIAELIDCDHHVVARTRTRLENIGAIAPAAQRTPRWPNGPRSLGRAQQAVADLGPGCSTREVMELSGVGRGAAWHARTHPRTPPDQVSSTNLIAPVADVAAATDAISVVRTQERIAYRKVTDRPTSAFYLPPDASHDLPCCTAEWTPAGWSHDRACPMRLAARQA